jgi:hypothetical protein
MGFGIKRSKADALFSDLMRLKGNYTCERCFVRYEPPTASIQLSHFFGRGGKSTRFDPENVAILCFGCHQHLGSNPETHRAFFLKKLGQKKYDALVLRAHIPAKVNEKLLAIAFKAELENMKHESNKDVIGYRAKK